MPTLPQRLRRPEPYLALVLLAVILGVIDVNRSPEKQVLGAAYGSSTGVYRWGKEKVGGEGACRFSPSCSRYSEEAVERFGVIKGLGMTYGRLQRCRTDVPVGTFDPVDSVKGSNPIPPIGRNVRLNEGVDVAKIKKIP